MSVADRNGILLGSFKNLSNKWDCFAKCIKRSDCLMIRFLNRSCLTFSKIRFSVSLNICNILLYK